MLSVGIVIVSYGSARWLPACLESLFEAGAGYPDLKIGLVENKIDPATLAATAKVIEPYLSRGLHYWPAPRNLGYGAGANWGWQQLGPTDLQIVLNPDMDFPRDWLVNFVKPFERDPHVGIAGCKLLDGEGLIQHAGGILGRGTGLGLHFGYGEPDDGRWDESATVEFVTGAALGIRRSLNEELGGFDPAFWPGYYEDVDLCWRARRAGHKVWYEATAVARHYEGATFGRAANYYLTSHRNRLRFVLKNLDSRQLLYQFMPSERDRLQNTLDDRDRQASAIVYRTISDAAINSGKKEAILDNSPNKDFDHFEAASGDLHDQSSGQADQLASRLAEVKRGWLVEEKPFKSRLPFVAKVRERFNSISTRWYVQPILAQQVEYNATVARTLEDLGRLTLGTDSANQMQTAVLSQRLLELENRLTRIEILLEKLAADRNVVS